MAPDLDIRLRDEEREDVVGRLAFRPDVQFVQMQARGPRSTALMRANRAHHRNLDGARSCHVGGA
jgi:hypothetical protein